MFSPFFKRPNILRPKRVLTRTLAQTLPLAFVAVLSAGMITLPNQAYANPLGFPGKNGMPESFADLIAEVAPAVVNIIAIENGTEAAPGSEGQGSGFVVTADGQVVTNYHVIRGADELTIEFGSGQRYSARIVGTDEESDIAVLKINADRPFEYVEFRGGKPIRVGDWVLAMGNPLGIGQSSTVGIISAIERDAEGSGPYVDYIQTDAVINRGNSGGPLFDLTGQVIGINSAIFSPTGASIGIGYAIPHFTAQDIVIAIQQDGRVRRGFFGAALRNADMSFDTDQQFAQGGATVESLVRGGPAQVAGIQIEDILLNIDGVGIISSGEATRRIGRLQAGKTVSFDLLRGNSMITVPVTLGERPSKEQIDALAGVVNPDIAAQAPTAPSGDTGMGLVDLSASFRDAIGMRSDQVGVYVDTVAPGSNAARKGLKSGMVILEIDSAPVPSVAQFDAKIANAKRIGKTDVLLKVRTVNGSENYVGLPL